MLSKGFSTREKSCQSHRYRALLLFFLAALVCEQTCGLLIFLAALVCEQTCGLLRAGTKKPRTYVRGFSVFPYFVQLACCRAFHSFFVYSGQRPTKQNNCSPRTLKAARRLQNLLIQITYLTNLARASKKVTFQHKNCKKITKNR